MLKNKGPTSIISLFYVMVIILVFCVFTTRATGWQHQFVSIRFNIIFNNSRTQELDTNGFYYNLCPIPVDCNIRRLVPFLLYFQAIVIQIYTVDV